MILTLDIGTTELKGALFDASGRLTRIAQRPLTLLSDPERRLQHETDALGWVRGVREVCTDLGVSPETQLDAIVVSGNGPTLVPIGDDDQPLHPAILWMDRRCVEEARQISELAGAYIDPTFYLPKGLWFRDHRPEIYERTARFMPCPEYINLLLTGHAATILPAIGFEPYIWTEELVTKLDMDWSKFPDFVAPGDILGRTHSTASETFGIPEGIPVIAGGPDFIVSIIGTGTVAPGRAVDRAGTSEGFNLCSPKAVSDPRLLCVRHAIEGFHNVSGIVSTSGKALHWFKEITGQQGVSFDKVFADIQDVSAGASKLVFLPYLVGERSPIWDPNARGAFIGLTMHHGRREMTRAVVESVGFAIRDILAVMEEDGLQIDEVRITGGQARSPSWIQIKADITGKPFLVPVIKEAELAGDLCLALYGLGRFDSLVEATEATVRIERTFRPNRANEDVYNDLFAIYRASYAGLKGPFNMIGQMDEQRPKGGRTDGCR